MPGPQQAGELGPEHLAALGGNGGWREHGDQLGAVVECALAPPVKRAAPGAEAGGHKQGGGGEPRPGVGEVAAEGVQQG